MFISVREENLSNIIKVGVNMVEVESTGDSKLRSSIGSQGFLGSSASKESACNAGDPCLIPGLGRSPGEGIGYPF